ncbi:MAG: DNA-binding domain-containing protein [Pseudomonadota bacterium]
MTAAVSASDGEAAMAAALLAPDLPAPAAVANGRRFAVYRNNVAVGLIDAIAATYPAVLALVGEDFFRAAAREFVLAHPPRSPILIEYGGDFPDWIVGFPPAQGVPYLGDVARIEWAWNRAYNAADAAPMDAARLAEVSPEDLIASRATLHPSISLIASHYPAMSIWAQATERVERSDLDMAAAEHGLIARPDETVDARAISSPMAAFLSALSSGATIGAAAEAFGDEQDLFAECLTALFQLRLVVGLDAAAEENQQQEGGE